MDQSLLSQLMELNVPLNEAKVYLALSETGTTSAGELIRKTGLHRSVVYESLDRLIDKKLVFKLEKKKIAHFQVTNPDRLVQQAESQVTTASELVPQLKLLMETNSPEITVYEGKEEYRRYWVEAMRRLPIGSTDYVAGSLGTLWQEYLGRDAKKFIQIHLERKITWKMLIFDQDQVEFELKEKYPELHQYRLIDREVAKNGNFNILGEESVVLNSTTEPMIIEVKNKTLVHVFQNLFDILWESGKEV